MTDCNIVTLLYLQANLFNVDTKETELSICIINCIHIWDQEDCLQHMDVHMK